MTIYPSPPSRNNPRAAAQTPVRGEVRGRNGEILMRRHRFDNMPNQFDVPADPNWQRMWVRSSCHGKDDSRNLHLMYEQGFRPVPASLYPDRFPTVDGSDRIETDGLILMERPKVFENEAAHEQRQAAVRQKHNQMAEFEGVDKMLQETGGSSHYFEPSSAQTDSRGVARPMLNRTIEKAPVDLYPQRELAVGPED